MNEQEIQQQKVQNQLLVRDTVIGGVAVILMALASPYVGSFLAASGNWILIGLGALLLLAFALVAIRLLWRFGLFILWTIVRTISHAWKGYNA